MSSNLANAIQSYLGFWIQFSIILLTANAFIIWKYETNTKNCALTFFLFLLSSLFAFCALTYAVYCFINFIELLYNIGLTH